MTANRCKMHVLGHFVNVSQIIIGSAARLVEKAYSRTIESHFLAGPKSFISQTQFSGLNT